MRSKAAVPPASPPDARDTPFESERDQISQNIEAVLDFYTREEQKISRSQRILERISHFTGQPVFLGFILLFVALWMLANAVLRQFGMAEFDPAPFFWLQGIVGLGALLTATVVLTKQNRLAKLAEQRAHLDLKVTLLTEQKAAKLIDLLEELRRDLPNVSNRHDPEAAALQQSMNPDLVLAALDERSETAFGKLTVADKTTPLKYAYARAAKSFFDKTKEDVLVILSDVPIPEEALKDEFARHHLAAEGKLHGVEVLLDAEKQAIGGGLLHEAWKEMSGYVSATGMHVFTPKTFDGKVAEGTLATRKPSEFMSRSFEYKATFSAPVWRRPRPTSSGPAAATSPQGKATVALLKAARSGKRAAMRKTMTAEAARGLDGPRPKEMLELLKRTAPDPATARIDAIDVKGNTAEVTVVDESKDGSVTSTFRLVLEGGQWKVSGG
jgi:uncharacterized membrane protein